MVLRMIDWMKTKFRGNMCARKTGEFRTTIRVLLTTYCRCECGGCVHNAGQSLGSYNIFHIIIFF